VHSSKSSNLLVKEQSEICFGCHNQDGLKGYDGRELENVKAELEAANMIHFPVDGGDCSDCHTSHGGDNHRLLAKKYVGTKYAQYDANNYELCFECHDSKALEVERTRDLTGFRDGDKNLHYLHVVEPMRGRTCRLCHAPHATLRSHLIRESFPFTPSYSLKPDFMQTENGGSCKGCHSRKEYDRTK
jgi:predicted CXXCH cytochrome family protein